MATGWGSGQSGGMSRVEGETNAAPPPGEELKPRRRGTSWAGRVAAVVLVLVSPVTAWWMTGPVANNEVGSAAVSNPDDYDYMVRGPEISDGIENLVGGASLVLLVLAVLGLAIEARRGRWDGPWWLPVGAAVAAGVIVGLTARVVTAPVIGANIGGGMMILFGLPLAFGLLVGSAMWSVRILVPTSVES
mgnify:CR=1 FL=1